MTAYNRGQVLYRVAEVMEGRHAQFCEEVAAGEGLSPAKARAAVDAAIDRWVWYAGWTDKLAAVLGGANPVAGPYFDFSMPEPTGVVAVLAPQQSSLLGLVSVLAPVLAGGQHRRRRHVEGAAAAGRHPRRGAGDQRRPGRGGQPAHRRRRGAGHLAGRARRRRRHRPHRRPAGPGDGVRARGGRHGQARRSARRPTEPDWTADPGLSRMTPFLETKTVWHPIGV